MNSKPDGTETDSSAGQAAPDQATPGAGKTLEEIIAELELQKADLIDRLLRAHAEMDNLRKRMEREKAELAKFAISKFAVDMVGVGDNFERAISAVPPNAADADPTLKSLLDGVNMTERAFLQALDRHGVKRLFPTGEPFDPNYHQAVMEQQDASVPSGSVLRVFQAGYVIDERVLRPAMVVVARGGEKLATAERSQDGPPDSAAESPPERTPDTSGQP